MECPTCFQKIVVPSRAGDSKLIYSATKVASTKPHEPAFPTGPAPMTAVTNRPRLIALVSLMVVAALGLGLAVYSKLHQRAERRHVTIRLWHEITGQKTRKIIIFSSIY